MSEDPLDKLINKLEGQKPGVKVTRANHTFYLNVQLITNFQVYCRSKGARPAFVLEQVIAEFLKKVSKRKEGEKVELLDITKEEPDGGGEDI